MDTQIILLATLLNPYKTLDEYSYRYKNVLREYPNNNNSNKIKDLIFIGNVESIIDNQYQIHKFQTNNPSVFKELITQKIATLYDMELDKNNKLTFYLYMKYHF